MLIDVGWLVLVWVIWIIVAAAALWLCRVTMHGQQEAVGEQESAIEAAQRAHGKADGASTDAATHAPVSAT